MPFKFIFVIDSIPDKPYMFDVDAYPLMNGIDVINRFDGHIYLLIGQDYAEYFPSLHLNVKLSLCSEDTTRLCVTWPQYWLIIQ